MMENQLVMKNRIVLVPFPFDDFSNTKVRPALCLTDIISNYEHIVICFISSKVSKANESSDIILNITDKNFEKSGLKVSLTIRLHRLLTIPKSLIQRELGVLPNQLERLTEIKIKELFNIK